MSPTGGTHGSLEAALTAGLLNFVAEAKLGRVMVGEVGVYIRRDPDTVRAADVLFISNQRLGGKLPSGYLAVAPELVVEILSPDDRWSEVTQKLGEYFSIGVQRVWVVDPRLRKVFAYRSPTQMQALGPAEVLQDEEILPGFSLRLAELFG